MSEKEFIRELENIGINPTSSQIEAFRKYSQFLLSYNTHTNLTAIKSVDEVYLKHFFDSLLLGKFYKFDKEKVLDIGSGAGFPGVPLKIVFPNIDLVVLDSNGKKTAFLEELKSVLGIEYSVINSRAEEYVSMSRELFDVVVSRAVTSMPILAELSLPFVKVGGWFIPYKGKLDETLEGGEFAICELGGAIRKKYVELLGEEKSTRTFVLVTKMCKTDEKYPRRFDKISKKPLQKKQ